MKATLETQKALIYLLKTLGVNQNNSIGAVLMLKDSEEATKEFFSMGLRQQTKSRTNNAKSNSNERIHK